MCNPSDDKEERANDADTDMLLDGDTMEDVVHVTTKQQEQKHKSILSTAAMEDCISTLRDVYVAVDFDTALWDSLFATGGSVRTTTSLQSTSNKVPVMPSRSMKQRDTPTIKNATSTTSATAAVAPTTPNSATQFATISTLASVLAFLEIDDSSVPPEYLKMEPASSGLELFMLHHPHSHDYLLQAITMMLLRITTELHSHHLSKQARSVQEHAEMLNRAIYQLTEINRSQLPEQSNHQQHHHHHHLPLHRAVSATATCTATNTMTCNTHPTTTTSAMIMSRQAAASHKYY